MRQKTLSFKVDDQFIRTPCYRVVADSKNYLYARFSFSDSWQGLTKTAVFTGADGTSYHMLLEDDGCLIPAEVIKPTRFLISVFGGDRLTTDQAVVEVEASGCVDGITPPVPTPDIYTQFVDAASTERQLAQAAAVTAGEQAEQSGNAAMMAMEAEERATSARNEAFFYASEAQEAEKTVQEAAEAASACATEAAQHADTVSAEAAAVAESAERAQEAERQAHNRKLECEEIAVFASDCAWNAELHAQAAKQAAETAAAAVASIPKTEWELLDDVTLTETAGMYDLNVYDRQFAEMYFEGLVKAEDKSKETQTFGIRVMEGAGIWQGTASFGAVDAMYVYGHMSLSPSGTYVCDATVSRYGYTFGGTAGRVVGRFREKSFTEKTHFNRLYLTLSGQFAAGTTLKVWGR